MISFDFFEAVVNNYIYACLETFQCAATLLLMGMDYIRSYSQNTHTVYINNVQHKR